MKYTPLLLNSLSDAGCSLVRIESKANDTKDEAWLQELLYRHPELLPVEEFGDSFSPAVSIGREVAISGAAIDNLFVSPEGGITIVETKLWKNPEKHRTVVAQIIDYAKELAKWDYDQLAEAVLASSRRRGEKDNASLEAKINGHLISAGVTLHDFQEGVADCLAHGNFLLLIVGDRVSPNIALLTRAIRSAPGLGFTLGLAEMQLFQMNADAEWPLIVVPEVLGRTVEKTRGVVQIRYVEKKPEVLVVEEDDADVEGGGIRKLDRELFIREIPKDLVSPYEQAIQSWENSGGHIRFTDKTMYFETELGREVRRVIKCRTDKINLIRRQSVEKWTSQVELHDQYLIDLEAAPAAAELARSDRTWIRYQKLSGGDLRVVLQAAETLVSKIKSDT